MKPASRSTIVRAGGSASCWSDHNHNFAPIFRTRTSALLQCINSCSDVPAAHRGAGGHWRDDARGAGPAGRRRAGRRVAAGSRGANGNPGRTARGRRRPRRRRRNRLRAGADGEAWTSVCDRTAAWRKAAGTKHAPTACGTTRKAWRAWRQDRKNLRQRRSECRAGAPRRGTSGGECPCPKPGKRRASRS